MIMSGCYLCGAQDARPEIAVSDPIVGATFTRVRCGMCGLAMTYPQQREEELRHYYQPAYYSRRKLFFDTLINRTRARAIMRRVPRAGRVLDVGCGYGSFLSLMQRYGWRVQGTELKMRQDMERTETPVPITYAALANAAFPPMSFCVITFWHVLEHVTEPSEYLAAAGNILKSGGLIVLEVPNVDSWQARAGGSRWFHLDVPRHTIHLTPRTATLFLEKAGFRVREIRHASFFYDVFGWIQTLLNMITRRQNLLFDILGGRVRWQAHARDTFITVLALPFVSLAALILHYAGRFFKTSSVITVFAEKP